MWVMWAWESVCDVGSANKWNTLNDNWVKQADEGKRERGKKGNRQPATPIPQLQMCIIFA